MHLRVCRDIAYGERSCTCIVRSATDVCHLVVGGKAVHRQGESVRRSHAGIGGSGITVGHGYGHGAPGAIIDRNWIRTDRVRDIWLLEGEGDRRRCIPGQFTDRCPALVGAAPGIRHLVNQILTPDDGGGKVVLLRRAVVDGFSAPGVRIGSGAATGIGYIIGALVLERYEA